VERLLASTDRVLQILLDGFGRCFLERHADHPLLRRLDAVHALATQFPSTTTAHVTTMHTGLPVWRHGLYEWNVYEPSLDRVITPLRFSFAGDGDGDTLLDAGFEPQALFSGEPTFYERLRAQGVTPFAFQPASFSPSTFDSAALRGADLRPYESFEDAVRAAIAALGEVERGYAYVYFDKIDGTGHLRGPSSERFDARNVRTLDAVEAVLRDASDMLVLLTADHGQVDVDPERTLWLDELHPPLAELRLRPAGSARDVFLHVPEEDVDTTVAALEPHVETHRVADLLAAGAFGPDPGPRLLERLGSVCVLPEAGRMAWLRCAPDFQQLFRGHHGGRTPEESETWLGELWLG
jgi:hypothetical protein